MRRTSAGAEAERKGARTRRRIVHEAAGLFNTRGFAGTSMGDVSAATGLEKGGVYNHFDSKDALALAAFEYAATLVLDRVEAAVRSRTDGPGQLEAMFDVYRRLPEEPFVKGGCPILNTAVEADDTHPTLRSRARGAMNAWIAITRRAIETGKADGAFRSDVDAAAAAAAIVAGLEGGVLLAKLYRDAAWATAVTGQLRAYVESLRAKA
jgi:AcrR family transcriptional regulator